MFKILQYLNQKYLRNKTCRIYSTCALIFALFRQKVSLFIESISRILNYHFIDAAEYVHSQFGKSVAPGKTLKNMSLKQPKKTI